ncbi:two-component sensor histidine kinase BarA [Vibrio sp. S4M6]|uniref:two-component sensor histidine kinase BarA n=1 Tax=Vibrio sinus TaxID=2946865 RepID=UPI00202A1BA1|nr:two-component sensor histidine kinase BarA [Vibrio sinus]MCL9781517.1 two-component sensor histidine kinase BarA [Vibrio sinus]
MTRYGLRARVITLTLAPTLIIGLLLSAFFSFSRYHDLEKQVINEGLSIIEPLAIASAEGLKTQNRESVRRLISYAHRKNSKFVRSIAVFDYNHDLFVTSNFHPNFQELTFPKDKPIPLTGSSELHDNTLILRAPILAEGGYISNLTGQAGPNQALGYIAVELDLSSLRLQQYQEIFFAFLVLLAGLGLSSIFAFRLLQDVTRPITHMKNMVDRIRRGHLDVRIEGKLHGELDALKNGINAMAVSLSEYHIEMQHSIDQATSDLRETLEQLEIQNVELDIAKKRAQEAARVKSEFLANMSHELRTPLNGVIGFTRQMLKTNLTNSQTDYLITIEKSANNLLAIINDILDFSKLEAGKLALENIPFEFQDSLEEVVSLQATSAHEKGLELTLKVDPKIPPGLVGDPLRIQQIMTNLVGNAIKFTEHGNVDISVEMRSQKEEYIELQFMIRDTGIGISERQQAQLFQAFSQADASISRRYGGTGLGLVITQKLVAQMGGEISLTSRLHQGSTFWFTVRMLPSDMPITDLYPIETLEQKTLLLIEPNAQAALATRMLLDQFQLNVAHTSTITQIEQHFDYLLLCLPPNTEHQVDSIEQQVEWAQSVASNVIISTPSTTLALADHLVQKYHIPCITKPLAKKKLLQALISEEPEKIEPVISPPAAPEKLEKLPLSVMAVDDNKANLKLIEALLEERVDLVVVCTSGPEAIKHATERQFDVILMDIQMPQMDGVTACKHIKKTKLNADTPVIAVTAHAMSGERNRLLDAGMDDYLTKPIEEQRLQKTLKYWSSHSSSTGTSLDDSGSIEGDSKASTTDVKPSQSNQIIDWQLALKQSAFKEDLAKDMLQMLIAYLPEVVPVIDKAIADSDQADIENLLHYIHKLHGSCAYSGVPRLKSVCATIEQALRSGSSIADVEPELFELQDEIEKVTESSVEYLST